MLDCHNLEMMRDFVKYMGPYIDEEFTNLNRDCTLGEDNNGRLQLHYASADLTITFYGDGIVVMENKTRRDLFDSHGYTFKNFGKRLKELRGY